jgi:hypothetical protein
LREREVLEVWVAAQAEADEFNALPPEAQNQMWAHEIMTKLRAAYEAARALLREDA